MSKIYVATGLERAAEARSLMSKLGELGHTITYDWTAHGSVQRDGPGRIAEVANAEAAGVVASNVFIALLPGGRGTHTELGIAIGSAAAEEIWPRGVCLRRIYLVGPLAGADGLECAFYRHRLVSARFETADELLGHLRRDR